MAVRKESLWADIIPVALGDSQLLSAPGSSRLNRSLPGARSTQRSESEELHSTKHRPGGCPQSLIRPTCYFSAQNLRALPSLWKGEPSFCSTPTPPQVALEPCHLLGHSVLQTHLPFPPGLQPSRGYLAPGPHCTANSSPNVNSQRQEPPGSTMPTHTKHWGCSIRNISDNWWGIKRCNIQIWAKHLSQVKVQKYWARNSPSVPRFCMTKERSLRMARGQKAPR